MRFACLFLLWLLPTAVIADPAAMQAVNALRAEKGRAALVHDTRLQAAAQGHADDMARRGYFSHSGRNGSTVGDRVRAMDYTWCFVAENIAQGQTSLAQVMAGWAASKGHYRNIIHRKARAFGLARGAGNTWVMVLAAPC